MFRARTTLASLIGFAFVAAEVFAATAAHAGDVSTGGSDTPAPASCNSAALTCASAGTALHGSITQRLNGMIDSGMIDKGLIKIQTTFTVDPVKPDALLTVDMPKGATVNASWTATDKGSITLAPVSDQGTTGTMNVHYTLTPSLNASIYGTSVSYNADDLLKKIPGSSFNYDATTSDSSLIPWGFTGASATPAPPALDDSTIFSLSFEDLGVDPGIVEGSLAIQAVARPTFKYTTSKIMFDSATAVTTADGTTKLSVADADFVEVNATVSGQLAMTGMLDMRPVVTVDTVDGVSTFGLVKYSFSAVSKAFDGAPTPVQFDNTTIHIPLPNIKVPAATLAMGDVKSGTDATKSVTINSTGEMDGLLTFESSDPQFTVPSGKITAKSKTDYQLDVKFAPSGDGPASATITVHSNDPDSPDQTFRVAANGASLEPDSSGDPTSDGDKAPDAAAPKATDGCACSTIGSHGPTSSSSGYGAMALVALGVVLASRRKKS